MKYFGTFDELSNEEDTIYNRLAAIKTRRDRLDYEKNDEWLKVKELENRQRDDKFKLIMWLCFTLIFFFMGIVGGLIPPPPNWVSPIVGYIVGVIASFMVLCGFVFIPIGIICLIVFGVRAVMYYLQNGDGDQAKYFAALLGIRNRNVLEAEYLERIKELSDEIAGMINEEEQLKARLEVLIRENADSGKE